MRSVILLLSLLVSGCSSSSATTVGPDDGSNGPVTACGGFSIYSAPAGARISVEVALPSGYDEASSVEYRTVYLLDANYFFDDQPGTLDNLLVRGEGMTKIVQRLAAAGTIPPVVLVGIDYTEADRTRLTMVDVEGFLASFTSELIPAIESRCHVRRSPADRVLFGYSASATFSTFVFFHDAYSAEPTFGGVISTSGLYDETQAAYDMEELTFQTKGPTALAGKRLFLSVGTEDPNKALLTAHRAFTDKITARGYEGVALSTSEYEGKGHYDIPEYAFERGLIWMFSN